uniref:HIRAN domain-containing protein n=1 Tax=Collinsella aerofaciens TaxID=74426 RepID=UPI001E44F7C5
LPHGPILKAHCGIPSPRKEAAPRGRRPKWLSHIVLSFHIAGFQYADGALVLGDLKVGDKLTLCAERDNPHDPEAVAIYYGNTKLGYVPGNEVGPLSVMMYYGHEGVFEARVQQVAPERSPWHQVRVGLYVVDAR